MAQVLFGGGISQVIGKHGGSVFQRGRGSTMMRAKSIPINNRGVNASAQKVALSNLSHQWSNNLTPSQIASWNSYASTNPVMNRLGQVTTLSGQQIFFKLNLNLLSQQFAVITTPPVSGAVGTMSSAIGTFVSGGSPTMSITVIITGAGAHDVGIVKLSPSLSLGRSFVSSQLRTMQSRFVSATPSSVLTEWQRFFGSGPATAGQQILGRAHVLNTDTGVISAELSFTTLWS